MSGLTEYKGKVAAKVEGTDYCAKLWAGETHFAKCWFPSCLDEAAFACFHLESIS